MDTQNEFDFLKKELIKENRLNEETLKCLENSNIPYKMSYYKIKSSEVLNNIELRLLNLNLNLHLNLNTIKDNQNQNETLKENKEINTETDMEIEREKENYREFYLLLNNSVNYLVDLKYKNNKNEKTQILNNIKKIKKENTSISNIQQNNEEENYTPKRSLNIDIKNNLTIIEQEKFKTNKYINSNFKLEDKEKYIDKVINKDYITLDKNKVKNSSLKNQRITFLKNSLFLSIYLKSIYKFKFEQDKNETKNIIRQNDNNNITIENRNPDQISISFFPDNKIPEYKIIPYNQNKYRTEYVKFFSKKKKDLIESLKTLGYDLSTLNKDKFIFVVFFNDMNNPNFKNIYFCDPESNFKEFYLDREDTYKNINIFNKYFISNGQIVLIEGEISKRNYENIIGIRDIKYGFDLQHYDLDKNYAKKFYKNDLPYCIYTLNGPFLGISDIDLTYFINTMKLIAKDNPHLIIINGPIFPLENKFIQEGIIILNGKFISINQLYKIFFTEIINIFKDLNTKIIICPSCTDIITDYPIPQPQLKVDYIGIKKIKMIVDKGIQFISNPSTFLINEMIFSVANFDFLSYTLKNSIDKNVNPLDSALESILLQKNFHPFIPMNDNFDESIDNILRVDYRFLSKLDLDIIPDVIFTHSKINYFTKVSNSTLFVNPGCFYIGDDLGFVCKMMLYPPDSGSNSNIFLNVNSYF